MRLPHQMQIISKKREIIANNQIGILELKMCYPETIGKLTQQVNRRSKQSTDYSRVNRSYSVQTVKKNACASPSSLLTHRVQESTWAELLTTCQQKPSKLHAENHESSFPKKFSGVKMDTFREATPTPLQSNYKKTNREVLEQQPF